MGKLWEVLLKKTFQAQVSCRKENGEQRRERRAVALA